MRVDYDKDLLACLIRKAGGDLRLVEKALGRASVDKNSPYVTEKDVEEAMKKIKSEVCETHYQNNIGVKQNN